MKFRLFPNDLEGVGRYRVLDPYGCLEAFSGHDVFMEVAPGYDDNSKNTPFIVPIPTGDVPESFDADVYVLQRRMEQYFSEGKYLGTRTKFGWPEIARWLRENGKLVVSDIDDWMQGLPVGSPGHDGLRERPHISIAAMLHTMRHSDILTVSTPALAEAYGHPNTHVLPNYLNWPLWKDVNLSYERDRKTRIGWMGVLKWRGRDLAVLQGLLGPWLERHPEVEFVAVGGPEPHDYLGVPPGQRRSAPWLKFPGHVVTTQEIDIGLVPLEYTKFNECKSYLKGMEYAACGIPCIATPTQQYREWVEPGVNGFLARRPKDWLRCLDEMLDGDAWREMGRQARLKAKGNKLQDHYHLWEEVIPGARSSLDAYKRQAGVHQTLLSAA